MNEIPRRVFLAKAASFILTLGGLPLLHPVIYAAKRHPYSRGVWLAGDHHIHTKFSADGQYDIVTQVANAERHGLGWCVITDHGGPVHDRIAMELAYPELQMARRRHPRMVVFQGLEWNVPAAEHGSVILPPAADEAKQIAEFEALFDEKNTSRPHTPANTEADAVAAIKYLEAVAPKSIFMANHPFRRGLDSPHELRAWADAGPRVTRGFEAAPGHQAATFSGKFRGLYGTIKPDPNSRWPDFPQEAYATYGGYDYSVAQIGGLWDSLLAEGRPWYITANSDSHRHYRDRTVVDASSYATKGYTTAKGQRQEYINIDFYPGEYSKTWVHASSRDPLAILDAMRAGNMFTVHGDLIDRLELSVHTDSVAAPMGGTLTVEKGSDITLQIGLRTPAKPNFGGELPKLHHIDIIMGEILGRADNRDSFTNPTTRLLEQIPVKDLHREGDMLAFRYKLRNVKNSIYLRIRGTNRDVRLPEQDSIDVNPWKDLWFYSNPVMLRLKP